MATFCISLMLPLSLVTSSAQMMSPDFRSPVRIPNTSHGEVATAGMAIPNRIQGAQLRLQESPAADIDNISKALVTPAPSVKADRLFDLLASLYGKVILSGQYGGATELNYVETVTGKMPVIRGFDMMDYSPSRVERGTMPTDTEKAIAWSRERGMVTFCWHWNAPKDLIDLPGKEWWRGFYTEATTFNLTRAMNDQSSEEYALIIRDIDAIAIQLRVLSDADVPVLWRPLHEAEGKWFWWGAKGPVACKWLWRLVFNRLVHHHQLNNLIWIWTSTASADALEWYPGDEYVDMIGADIYLPAGDYGSSALSFDNLARLYEGRKIVALSENGPIPDPDKLFADRTAWSWFATWSGGFVTDGITNARSHLQKVYGHEYVITLDEIEDLDEIVKLLQIKRDSEVMEEPVTNTEDDMQGVKLNFPNPLNGERLIVHTANISSMIIYNLYGQVQFPEIHTTGDAYVEFDFTDKPAGLYILKVVKNRRSVEMHRILKEY